MNELNFTLFQNNLPPCNTDAEEAILGGILLDPGAMERISKTALQPESFYLSANQVLFSCFQNLHENSQPTDLICATAWLRRNNLLETIGGQCRLVQLVSPIVSAVNIDRYAEIVLEKAVRRQLISLGNSIVSRSYDQLIEAQEIIKGFQVEFENLKSSVTIENKNLKQYNRLIKRMGDIELSELSPGAKRYELICLSKEFRITVRELEDIYFKSLIDKENEPLQTLEELFNKYQNTERQWLMQGILPQGITAILHAKGGVGKTLLAYYLASCLVSGRNLDQFTATKKKRKGWILQTDESPEDMVQRLRDLDFPEETDLKVKTKWTFDHIPTLRKEIERERPDFLIIDSVTSNSKNSIVSENDVVYSKPVLLLNEIAAEFGCTILLIHHSSHEGNARGTTALYNAVGLVMRLETDPQSHDEMERILTFQKARSRSTAKYRLRMNWEDHSWSVIQKENENPDGPIATSKTAVLNYLESHRGIAFEAQELYQEIGTSLDNIRRVGTQLAADGLILKKGGSRGSPSKYFLPSLHEEVNHSGFSDPTKKTVIRNVIRNVIRTEPAPSIGYKNTDHLITESAENGQEIYTKKRENDDQNDQKPQSPTQNQSCSDHVSDHDLNIKEPLQQNTDHDDQNNQVKPAPAQEKVEAEDQLQIGKLAEVRADIPSLESLNGKRGVIDLVGTGVCRLRLDDGGFQYVPHRYLVVIGEGTVSKEIESLIFNDKVSTKSGKRSGYVSKVRGYRSGSKKYDITWNDTDETITYSLEEIQMAGFREI